MYPVHYITLDINNSYSAQYTVMKGRTDNSRTLVFKLRNGSQIISIPQDAVAVLCGEYEATVAATEDAAETTATKTVALSCTIKDGTASVSLPSLADCTGGEVVLVLKVTDGGTTLCAPKIRVLLDSTAASVPEDEDAVTFLTAQRTAAEAAAKAAQAAADAAQTATGTALYTKDGSTETLFTKGILGRGLKLNETAQTIYVETFDQMAASDDNEKPVSYKDFKAATDKISSDIGDVETALAGI